MINFNTFLFCANIHEMKLITKLVCLFLYNYLQKQKKIRKMKKKYSNNLEYYKKICIFAV